MTADRTRHEVDTVAGRLHVESAGSGPALLCWPSLFCDGRTLEPQVDEFARDHRVIVVDGPGHGRSGPPPGRFTLDACARAAVRVLDALAVERAVFVGTAWGGHVGAVTVAEFAPRFRAFVAMNAPMNAWTGLLRVKFWTLYSLFRLLGPAGFIVEAVVGAQLSPSVRAAHPERAAVVAGCVRGSEPRGLALAIRSAMLDRPSLLPHLPRIRVPTLFVTGDQDAIYPVEVARAQAGLIPGARFEVVAGTAHQSPLEKPEAVNPLIREFLKGLG